MHLKMSSAKWRLFGIGLNELKYTTGSISMKCANMIYKNLPWWRQDMGTRSTLPPAFVRGITRDRWIPLMEEQYSETLVFHLLAFREKSV